MLETEKLDLNKLYKRLLYNFEEQNYTLFPNEM